MKNIQSLLKRTIDVVISFFAIIVLTPFWIVIAIAIYFENPGPIFYLQERVGYKGKPFKLFKFRSMVVNDIPPLELGSIKHNHSLVTRVGYVLRRFKLDETPQFLNVLIGTMSLIGPRPCLLGRIPSMSQTEQLRFNALPGLSGWAEVNGNVDLTWQEQVWLDVWYVKHHHLLLDAFIIVKTFIVVLFGSKKNDIALSKAYEQFSNLDN
ncbi:MAG: sugar transferase [Gammaproteobacteria bacterium]|nr:sugar transferase [Gammaproteobacteria bacterium]